MKKSNQQIGLTILYLFNAFVSSLILFPWTLVVSALWIVASIMSIFNYLYNKQEERASFSQNKKVEKNE